MSIFNKKLTKRNQLEQRDYKDKLISPETPFAINEAFKTLRTNLFYTSKNELCPVFCVTSAFAHAGKSVVISNLAVSYAQMGKKVLIIDADMRCPVQQEIFKIDNKKGFSEYIAGTDSQPDDFIRSTPYENLSIITSGRIPPNPSELLASDRVKAFITEMKQKYDFIFIDMPPICEVSDAGVISGIITGYIFVIRSGVTDAVTVQNSIDILKQVDANIVGFVLNDVNPKLGGKYSKYGKYGKYGYYHNYGESNTENNK